MYCNQYGVCKHLDIKNPTPYCKKFDKFLSIENNYYEPWNECNGKFFTHVNYDSPKALPPVCKKCGKLIQDNAIGILDEQYHYFCAQLVLGEIPPLPPVKSTFDTGYKYDGGKPRYDLIPTKSLRELAEVLTFGAQKYAPDNWKKIDDFDNRYYSALLRHLEAWRDGEEMDLESGKPHLAHALCCLVFLNEGKTE